MNQDHMYREAAEWQLKLAGQALDADQEQALALWLARDPRHREALAEVGIAWYGSANALESDVALAAIVRRSERRWPAWFAGAALAPLLAFVLAQAPQWWTTWHADELSAVGEVRSFVLPDGSTAWLDSDSAVALGFSAAGREVTLLRGAAWFEVVPDAARPFRVAADALSATALGTVYGVDARGDVVEVAVSEGRVAVDAGSAAVTLAAGQHFRSGPGADGVEISDARAQARQAWREGLLSFHDEPLPDALARLDRYLPQRLLLLGDTAGTDPVTAVFPLADAELALDALARSHGLSVRRLPGLILIGG
jgi:transmembrane sensor